MSAKVPLLSRVLRLYHGWISPGLHAVSGYPGGCRFVPTCSEYAADAIEQYGVVRGSALAMWRLLRCHPFSRGGLDPVPIAHGDRKGHHHLS